MNKLYLLKDNYPSDETIWVPENSYIDVSELNNSNASTQAMAASHIVPLITHPSSRTLFERNKFAAQVDDFASFTWANIDMFNNFGAFIINEQKGSLKIYNGPSFKNEYSKPQFQDGYTNLTGVTFNTQTISFTIGVYWISIEDYRILINLLHPYEVNMLSFDFEKTYGYFCKLQSIKDSTRYIVGKEPNLIEEEDENKLKYSHAPIGNVAGTNSARYYTELNLTFEIIGAQCAKELEPIYLTTFNSEQEIIEPPMEDYGAIWDWTITTQTTPDGEAYIKNTLLTLDFGNPVNSHFISDLDYPFEINFPHLYVEQQDYSATIIGQVTLQYGSEVVNTQQLFKIGLKNISWDSPISLIYNSEHGILYWKTGNQTKILNLLSTQSNGQRILDFIDTINFMWPGKLDFVDIEQCHLILSIIANNVCLWESNYDPSYSGITILQSEQTQYDIYETSADVEDMVPTKYLGYQFIYNNKMYEITEFDTENEDYSYEVINDVRIINDPRPEIKYTAQRRTNVI